ncbi:hypothetical protein JCM8097_002293 [Rhodosporidiobolus ruineniae]
MPKEAKPRATKGAAKAKKDPNAPKRPLSAYMHFSQAERASVKEENPDVKFGEIGKILGARWKELDDEDKKPFEEKAKADKARYEKEKAAYDDENGTAKPAPKKKAAPKKKKADSDDDEDEEDDDESEDEKLDDAPAAKGKAESDDDEDDE